MSDDIQTDISTTVENVNVFVSGLTSTNINIIGELVPNNNFETNVTTTVTNVDVSVTDTSATNILVDVIYPQGPPGPPGTGTSLWGSISGTLSAQTDLWAYLSGVGTSNFDITTLNNYLSTNIITLSSTNTKGQILSAGVDLFNIFRTTDSDSQTLSYIPSSYFLSISNGNTVNLSSINSLFGGVSGKYESVSTVVQQGSSNWYSASGAALNAANNFTQTNFLPLTGGTISGPLYILSSLYISGSAFYVNAQDLIVSDPIIYIAEDNQTDLLDIGLIASWTNAPGYPAGYQHGGLIRRADNKTWTLFSGATSEPLSGLNVEWSQPGIQLEPLSAKFYGDIYGNRIVYGSLSSTNIVYAQEGNSNQWNSAHTVATTYQSASSTFAPKVELRQHSMFSSGDYAVLQGRNVELGFSASATGTNITITLPRQDTNDNAQSGDELLIRLNSVGVNSTVTIRQYQYTGSLPYLLTYNNIVTFNAGTPAQTIHLRLGGSVWSLIPSPNLFSPTPIGNITPSTGAFTTLTVNNGLTIAGNISGNNLRTSFNQGTATGDFSLAEGAGRAFGNISHAEGTNTIAFGIASHVEGINNLAFGEYSHAAGNSTTSTGAGGHTEGYRTVTGERVRYLTWSTATKLFTFSPDLSSKFSYVTPGMILRAINSAGDQYVLFTVASRDSITGTISATSNAFAGSNSNGFIVTNSGQYSHAEGNTTTASGQYSHAEGSNTESAGLVSHAMGSRTKALSSYTFAGGRRAVAMHENTYVWATETGTYEVSSTRAAQYMVSASGGVFLPGSLGIGTDSIDNALTVVGTISTSQHGDSSQWRQSLSFNEEARILSISNGNNVSLSSLAVSSVNIPTIVAYLSTNNISLSGVTLSPITTLSGTNIIRSLQDKLGEVVSVKDFGARGDGVTNDTAALQLAFNVAASSAKVYIPRGIYMIRQELKIPSNSYIYGAGIGTSVIKLSAGVSANQCVMTNSQNTRNINTNQGNVNIIIKDLELDGNVQRFPGSYSVNEPTDGTGLCFAFVQDALVERVSVHDCCNHCFDICAPTTTLNSNPLEYTPNPSSNIHLKDIIAYGAGDDNITTHFSRNIIIENVYVPYTGGTLVGTNSNGIEIDDGSYDVTIIGGYIKNCRRGLEIKGHSYAPAAKRIRVYGLTVEGCVRNFGIRHLGFDNTDSQTAYDVALYDCTSIAPISSVFTTDGPRSLQISNYDGVYVKDFKVVGEHNASRAVTIQERARNVRIDGMTFTEISGSVTGVTDALLYIDSTTQRNVTLQNITFRNCVGQPIYATGNIPGITIDSVDAYTTVSPRVSAVIDFTWSPTTVPYTIRNVSLSGYDYAYELGGSHDFDYTLPSNVGIVENIIPLSPATANAQYTAARLGWREGTGQGLNAGIGVRMDFTSNIVTGVSAGLNVPVAYIGTRKVNGTDSDVTSNLTFGTLSANNSTLVDRITITPTGLVGINTTTPNERLTVIGNISGVGSLSVLGPILSAGIDIRTLFGTNFQTLTFTESSAELSISNGNIVSLSPINTTFATNSGKYESVYTTVQSSSGSWNKNYIYVSTNTNLSSNFKYAIDTTSGSLTAILPPSPQTGDEIEIFDILGTWGVNNLVVNNNTHYIEQQNDNLLCNVRFGLVKLIYTNNNTGWRIVPLPLHDKPSIGLPNISISINTLSSYIPLTVSLTGINNLDASIAPVDSWSWDLSGNSSIDSTSRITSITYNAPGVYTITLTGSNSVGIDTASVVVTAVNILPPSVSIGINSPSGEVPFTVSLTGINNLNSIASPISAWYWNLSGDSQVDSQAQITTYSYETSGAYTVTLSGINSVGVGTAFVTVTATPPPIPTNGLLVRFNADSGVSTSGSNITSWTDQQNGVVATAFNNPTLLTNVFNGRRAVSFDGINDYFTGTFGTQINSDTGRTFVIIGKYNAVSGQTGIFDGSSDLQAYIFQAGGGLYYNNGPQIGAVTGDFTSNYFIQIVNTSDASGSTTFRVDGVDRVTDDMNRPQMTGFNIGRRGNGNEYVNFNLVELLVYNRSLTQAEMEQIETYANV